MDQYVSVFGEKHAAIQIDCRSLEHRTVHLPDGVEFLAVNTMVKHELTGLRLSRAHRAMRGSRAPAAERFPGVESLRDATLGQLEQVTCRPWWRAAPATWSPKTSASSSSWPPPARGDVERMGQLFVESHRSLQHDYEVSCAELDFLVDRALEIEGVYGARMTGGGFGGCTVNMMRPDAVERFRGEITRAYEAKFPVTPQIYPVRPSAGAGEIR